MKEIKAFIRPQKLTSVVLALYAIPELGGVSLSEVRGFGCSRPVKEVNYVQALVDYTTYVRLEIVCPDNLESGVVLTIQTATFSGESGDGQIFVSDITKAVRITSDEHGDAALLRRLDKVTQDNNAINLSQPETIS